MLPARRCGQQRRRYRRRYRLLAALLTAAPLPFGTFLPDPLPHCAPLPMTALHDDPDETAA
jgi:hypothetical protein